MNLLSAEIHTEGVIPKQDSTPYTFNPRKGKSQQVNWAAGQLSS